MRKLTVKKHINIMVLLCVLVYFVSYIAKINYGAVILEIVQAEGLLNSCTYIGSAISTHGIAKISENAGWYITILSWSAIALIGTIICFSCAKAWEEFCKNN
ncbi:MAG TPA: hypothetical protein GX527_06500 [Clostridiaceae bacterium]|nr:hypothetical protein [Clostridiaceae bacterium]